MYTPKQFDESDIAVMHKLIRARPLATVITLSSGGLNANHIPLLLSDRPGPHGTLRGHVARVNPMWNDFSQDLEALAVFQGPDAYITPSWYATKQETGKVVPTWNYAAVHAYGRLRIVDDAAWVRNLLEQLTAEHEARFEPPWTIRDAPADFIEKLLAQIVGIEIVITRLQGKWKVSQNQPSENQAGVIAGLRNERSDAASAMAELVVERFKDLR